MTMVTTTTMETLVREGERPRESTQYVVKAEHARVISLSLNSWEQIRRLRLDHGSLKVQVMENRRSKELARCSSTYHMIGVSILK